MSEDKKNITKRKSDSTEGQSTSKNLKTPEKDKYSSGGSSDEQKRVAQQSTPQKSRLTFDWFNPKDDKSDNTLPTSQNQSGIFELRMIDVGRVTHTVRFRVVFKSALKCTKIGKVFNFHGVDKSGNVGFVVFPGEADNLFPIIQMNKVYELDTFLVRKTSEDYPNGIDFPFEIQVLKNSIVTPVDDDKSVPAFSVKFIGLGEVSKSPLDSHLDTMGVMVRDWQLEKTSGGLRKRDISLIDSTKSNLLVTLWGEEAETFTAEDYSVIIILRGVVSQYHGIPSLNCTWNSTVWLNPEIKEAIELREWFSKTPRPLPL